MCCVLAIKYIQFAQFCTLSHELTAGGGGPVSDRAGNVAKSWSANYLHGAGSCKKRQADKSASVSLARPGCLSAPCSASWEFRFWHAEFVWKFHCFSRPNNLAREWGMPPAACAFHDAATGRQVSNVTGCPYCPTALCCGLFYFLLLLSSACFGIFN